MSVTDPLPDMTEEEARSFRWALDQGFPSVSARSAKSIAGYIERHRADLTLSPSAIMPHALQVVKDLIDALEPIKNNPRIIFSGFPEYAFEQGKAFLIGTDPTFSPSAPRGVEQRYSTKALIENLQNALDSGYDYLGETDIGDLLQTIKDNEEK